MGWGYRTAHGTGREAGAGALVWAAHYERLWLRVYAFHFHEIGQHKQ
jgi:hypothetical protein